MILITPSTTTLASVWGEPLSVEVRMEGEGSEDEKGIALPGPPKNEKDRWNLAWQPGVGVGGGALPSLLWPRP